jgi:hypothetical protein
MTIHPAWFWLKNLDPPVPALLSQPLDSFDVSAVCGCCRDPICKLRTGGRNPASMTYVKVCNLL